ncbi:MAG: hypothetical protein DRJ03_28140 [Chloroflexi bacterium]|nr:MAG: hypothetical protein DRJ03_28140 [Chloroflexota bacterium]
MFEIPDDYEVKTGDVISTTYAGVNNAGVPIDDNAVINHLMSASTEEVETEVYRQTGARIKIRNRRASVVTPGYEYRYVVEYEVVEAKSPTAIVLAALIIGVIVATYYLLEKLDWFVERMEKRLEVDVGGYKINLFAVFMVFAVLALLVALLKR